MILCINTSIRRKGPPVTSEHPSIVHDVAIIGAGPAGLAAALALGRSRRTVALIDAGKPRNRFTPGMHNVIGFDGVPPSTFRESGLRTLAPYGIVPVQDEAIVATRRDEHLFDIETATGKAFTARRLLLTTGFRDVLPDLPGFQERWGKDVLHCPYCHGYEVRDTRIGVFGIVPEAIGHVLLQRQLSADTTLFLNGIDVADDAIELRRLVAMGVTIERRPVRELVLHATDRHLEGVALDDGSIVGLDALFVVPKVNISSPLIDGLGLETTDGWQGRWVITQQGGRTNVPGVFAAGNLAEPMGAVPSAIASGSMAGAFINSDLAVEYADRALANAS
jgi:thioredoxin reductase